MFTSIAITPFLLSAIVIVSLVICKYFHSSGIFLLVVILASIFYQRDTNKKNNKRDNFEDILINVSKFIIITGILGYLVVRIVGLFLPGFA
jgi:prolipoprotein diacylglyceryltransferase